MAKWYVEIDTADQRGITGGREIELEVDADTSKDAMIKALDLAELQPDELLHSLFAHIGAPQR